MTISQSIQREKEQIRNYQLGGSTFGNSFQRGIDLLGNVGLSYYNGLQIGQGLGYNENSQKDLGLIGGFNALLNSSASLIQDGRRNKESEQDALERRLRQYMRVPRDRYAYDPFTENNYTQDYYKHGGQSTHGIRTSTTFNRSGYKTGRKDFLNRYDSYQPIRNKHIGPSNNGFTSVFGKDGLDFSHVTNTNGRTHAPKERHINFTGFTEGTPSNKNSYNIIPGNHITSKGMDKDTVLDVYPIHSDNSIGKRFPFAYKQGSPDIINPYQGIKGFLEVKRQ